MRRLLLGLLTAVCTLWVPVTHSEAQEAPQPITTINGAQHPELIPAELMWETAFRTLWATATYPGDQPTASGINVLSRRALHIPESDVRKLLKVTQETLDRLRELREPFDREHSSGKSLGWTHQARERRSREIGDLIIDGRDQLVCSLSDGSFKALKQWVSKTVVPGIKVDIYGEHK